MNDLLAVLRGKILRQSFCVVTLSESKRIVCDAAFSKSRRQRISLRVKVCGRNVAMISAIDREEKMEVYEGFSIMWESKRE